MPVVSIDPAKDADWSLFKVKAVVKLPLVFLV